ncbi:MAG TPA: CerR family C-terminal domain-containing protein [Candidatus Acidoferrales bacterium]|nr:CerR family C-terminal domain-containing protein [Candidatus Acidoferrales bacterium]
MGYPKGRETRQRILDVALQAFGDAPFAAVTTRQLAEIADASLPTLRYYFGGKEGLYRACAEAIVERFRAHMAPTAARAAEALREDPSPEAARMQLKAVMGTLAGFLIGSTESERWSHFVAREMRDPGPAFDILFEHLWQPGVATAARLIAHILGCGENDVPARITALLLVSSLLAFQSGRSVSMRIMHWTSIGEHELAMVVAGLDAQMDAIGRR